MSKRYPKGYDDEFFNIIKDLIDRVHAQGQSIQTLVAEGQLTPEEYAQLLTVINRMIAKGDVSLEDIDFNIKKIGLEHLSEDVKAAMAGDTPILSEIADGAVSREKILDRAVSPEKMNIFNLSNNIFDVSKVLRGRTVEPATGNIINDSGRWISGYISARAGDNFSVTSGSYRIGLYDHAQQPIMATGLNGTQFQVPNYPETRYIVLSKTNVNPPEEMMMNPGTTLLPYEPHYAHIKDEYLSIDIDVDGEDIADDSIDLKKLRGVVKSKNLFTDPIMNHFINRTNGQYVESVSNNASRRIKVEPETTYTLSGNIPTGYVNVAYYGSNGNFVTGAQFDATSGGYQSFRFDIPENAAQVVFSFSNRSTNIQFEKGDVATIYEPYYLYLPDIVDPRIGGGSSTVGKNALSINEVGDITLKLKLSDALFGSYRYSNKSTGDDFLKGRESGVFDSNQTKLYNLTDEFSNKEFALKVHDDAGNESWFPEHVGEPTAFLGDTGFIKLIADGNEVDLSQASGDIYFEEVTLIQKVECSMPTDESPRAIITFIATMKDGKNKNKVRIEWLKDTRISSGYIFMAPMDTQNFVSHLLTEDFTQIVARPNATENINTHIDNLENDVFYFTSARSGKTDILFTTEILKQTEGLKDLYWQHRSGTIEKLYPKQYHNTNKIAGDIDYFEGEYRISAIPNANEIYTLN